VEVEPHVGAVVMEEGPGLSSSLPETRARLPELGPPRSWEEG
jgi:hypothetical protein